MTFKEINAMFKEPVHKILERIKNEPYFQRPSKMGGDPTRRNQSIYCTYHWDKGHTTEQCQVFRDHLEQLVKSKHLKKFVVNPEGDSGGEAPRSWGNTLSPPLCVIKVIHAASMGTIVSQRKGVLSVVLVENARENLDPGRKLSAPENQLHLGMMIWKEPLSRMTTHLWLPYE